MQEELNQFKKWAVQTWAKSLVFFLALMIGILAGNMMTEGRIINDCKYMSNFRIGEQSYVCQRKI
jgi:hypothetical protein